MPRHVEPWHCPECHAEVPLPDQVVMQGIPICAGCWTGHGRQTYLCPGRSPRATLATDVDAVSQEDRS